MLQLDNRTPFVPAMTVFPDADGVDALHVVLKATFAIAPDELRIAAEQRPVVPADEYWGDQGVSSVKYEGESSLPKPATDVVVVGSGFAPGGRPAPELGVAFSVGRLRKVLQVTGDRKWTRTAVGLRPSTPIPAASVPLLWERAFGGKQEMPEGRLLAEMRNPVGCGFRGKRDASELVGTPVPNLEDPANRIEGPGDRYTPVGVGFIAPSWEPRIRFGGTYDAAWQKGRAPYLPRDFDPRFLQTAPPDQVYPGFIQGGEPVGLVNLSPLGNLRFALPQCELGVEVHIGRDRVKPRMRVETVLLEPGDGRLSLLWRGVVGCDKRALEISKAVFQVNRLRGVVD